MIGGLVAESMFARKKAAGGEPALLNFGWDCFIAKQKCQLPFQLSYAGSHRQLSSLRL